MTVAPLFQISLAQWSLHRMIESGELDPLDTPRFVADTFGLHAVEYVNRAFAETPDYESLAFIDELARQAEDAGVRNLLIMIDREGAIGDPDDAARAQTIDNHRKYLDAAQALGCHSIRVNARSVGSRDEQANLVADGLRALCEAAEPYGMNVLVENHGGLSSDGSWLANVMRLVDHPRVGTLPDFGNFCLDWDRKEQPDAWYDRYKGVEELMPFAKAVSAKSNNFDDLGNEVHTDFARMMRIVLNAGYHGYVGIEYEGDAVDEVEGVKLTQNLLMRVREELVSAPATG